MKAIFLIFLIFHLSTAADKNNFAKFFRFQSIECKVFDNASIVFEACSVSTLSKTSTALNVVANFLEPIIKPVYASFVLSFRHNSNENFREVLRNEIEYCSALESQSALIKYFTELKESLKKVFVHCPLIGQIGAYNITTPDELPFNKIVPSGFYQDIWQMKKNGKVIGSVKYFFASRIVGKGGQKP